MVVRCRSVGKEGNEVEGVLASVPKRRPHTSIRQGGGVTVKAARGVVETSGRWVVAASCGVTVGADAHRSESSVPTRVKAQEK